MKEKAAWSWIQEELQRRLERTPADGDAVRAAMARRSSEAAPPTRLRIRVFAAASAAGALGLAVWAVAGSSPSHPPPAPGTRVAMEPRPETRTAATPPPSPRPSATPAARPRPSPAPRRKAGPSRPRKPRGPIWLDDRFTLNGDGFAAYAARSAALLRAPGGDILQALPSEDERDTFIEPELLTVAADGPAAAAGLSAYERQKVVIDPRLQRKVSLGRRAVSFADLCESLTRETGIAFSATRSVADDKVTVFCTNRPLRELMREIASLFGFVWERAGADDAWEYRLKQPLRTQLLEEELRNRDRREALLALDHEMERFQRRLDLSPEEARALAESASGAERERLKALGGIGWGPARLYFGLDNDERKALFDGKPLSFRGDGDEATGTFPLPADLGERVLGSLAGHAFIAGDSIWFHTDRDSEAARKRAGQSPQAVPGATAIAGLQLTRDELGQFTLLGISGFANGGSSASGGIPLAHGISPSVASPQNAEANAARKENPPLRREIALPPRKEARKVSTADVLEAIHRATGRDVLGDYFTRLYEPEPFWPTRPQPLFDALCRLSDATRLRWEERNRWLTFRSTDFFNMRLKEVPNRLLERWAAQRRSAGALGIDQFREIARLTEDQLDAESMAEGAKRLYGLAEWDIVRSPALRPSWRFVDALPSGQRAAMLSEEGLRYSALGLDARQRFLTAGYEPGPLRQALLEGGEIAPEIRQKLETRARVRLEIGRSAQGSDAVAFEYEAPADERAMRLRRLTPHGQSSRISR